MGHTLANAAFRDALAQFASGVTVVAAYRGHKPLGLTATAFAAASLHPPLVLICVDKVASAHDGVLEAGELGVSILEQSQQPLALRFARSGVDRFQGVGLRAPSSLPVPLIEGALAHLECKRHAAYAAGDHTLVLAEVMAASVGPGSPLLHHARRFGGFAQGSPPAGGGRR